VTTFLRLLENNEKEEGLKTACRAYRQGQIDNRVFGVEPEEFFLVPKAPFCYWVSETVRGTYNRLPSFGTVDRTIKQGLATADDFRFVRAWWEPLSNRTCWMGFAKGGTYSPFYSDVYLVVNWNPGEKELWEIVNPNIGKPKSNIWMLPETIRSYFLRPGITWPRRTKSRLSMRALPANCIFADKGPAAFVREDDVSELCSILAVGSSRAFHTLIEMQLAAADARAGGAAHSFEVGVIQRMPFPILSRENTVALKEHARSAWSLRRSLDSVSEISHAFLLPAVLRTRVGHYDAAAIEEELVAIQDEIDAIVFDIYGFRDTEQEAVSQSSTNMRDVEQTHTDDDDESGDDSVFDGQASLLAWCIGVVFGRFDWRLAIGERQARPDPEPFDPLPIRSPGMLPGGAAPYDDNGGILVDDPGLPQDLAHLIESVLDRVDVPVPPDVRRWLQREFFPEHLKQYSKSRRKAPIYWPLATASACYTIWVYYPALTGQTLYTAVNDFIEPKLKSVAQTAQSLRSKTNRSRAEKKELEQAQDFELELTELRDTLLQIVKDYKPSHDDGVQITAAPLWPLFRHRPWQKVLKDTWKKLEKGDYDWAHLAMNYWPDRVRDKCRTDKSLAIAHGLEELYDAPAGKGKKKRSRSAAGE